MLNSAMAQCFQFICAKENRSEFATLGPNGRCTRLNALRNSIIFTVLAGYNFEFRILVPGLNDDSFWSFDFTA